MAKTSLPNPIFHEPAFAEGQVTPDPKGFMQPHPSDDALYKQVNSLLTKQVTPFQKSRMAPDGLLSLADVYGARGNDVTTEITQAGRIVFHAIGDSGASASKHFANELSVADQLTLDCNVTVAANRPSFLMHLGDVVYDFGESQYYYDQFYDPFRNYPAPILAIPGNHDSFVVPGTPAHQTPLDIFMRNFCAEGPDITTEAGSLHRTAMTQPGVYFAFDAPFVRLICLFSNALEDPGAISSQGGKWPTLPDFQLDFLEAQFQKIRDDKYAGAVLLAVHHPPFAYQTPDGIAKGSHASSIEMLAQIDAICAKAGVYPHAFLSGHAHNYQRYTRTVSLAGGAFQVPFIVCGDGGHNVNLLVEQRKDSPGDPGFGLDVGYMDSKPAITAQGLQLVKYNDTGYGYLRVDADAQKLGIGFHLVGQASIAQSRFDKVTVDLASHQLLAN